MSLWGEDYSIDVCKILSEHRIASIKEESLDNGIILHLFMFGFFFFKETQWEDFI